MLERRHKSRLFYGWIIVATSAIGLLFGAFPIVVASFGVFFPAYLQEFHTGRASVAFAFTAHNLVAAVSSAFLIGRLADRFGARTIALIGSAALGIILIGAQAIGPHVWQLYLLYCLLGAVGAATTAVPYALVVARWFNRRRGLALGLMMTGMGAGAVLVPPLAQRLIAASGWRTTLATFGCAVILVSIPAIALFLKESPETLGLLPDEGAAPQVRPVSSEGFSWPEIYKSPTFWLMTAAFMAVGAGVHACILHLPQMIADRHGDAAAIAAATSVLGLALFTGRLATGYFLDRHFAPRVASLIFGGAVVGILFVWISDIQFLVLTGALLVGLAFGAEADIIAYLMSRYFGLRSLGAAVGFAFGAFVLAGGIGPLLMDFVFDKTGSYGWPLVGFALLTLLGAALVGRLGPYRFEVSTLRTDGFTQAACAQASGEL